MSTIASQITSLVIVYSAVYSDADQRKHQSSVSLAFVRGIHRGQVNFPHKWPVTRRMFPFDDHHVMMTIWIWMSWGTCHRIWPRVAAGHIWLIGFIFFYQESGIHRFNFHQQLNRLFKSFFFRPPTKNTSKHHIAGPLRSEFIDSYHKLSIMRKAFLCHDVSWITSKSRCQIIFPSCYAEYEQQITNLSKQPYTKCKIARFNIRISLSWLKWDLETIWNVGKYSELSNSLIIVIVNHMEQNNPTSNDSSDVRIMYLIGVSSISPVFKELNKLLVEHKIN